MRKQLIGLLLALLTSHAYAEMQIGIQGKSQGDIIAVNMNSEIAAWCNFDKQIIVTSTTVLCVYTGSKQVVSLDPKESLSKATSCRKNKINS